MERKQTFLDELKQKENQNKIERILSIWDELFDIYIYIYRAKKLLKDSN